MRHLFFSRFKKHFQSILFFTGITLHSQTQKKKTHKQNHKKTKTDINGEQFWPSRLKSGYQLEFREANNGGVSPELPADIDLSVEPFFCFELSRWSQVAMRCVGGWVVGWMCVCFLLGVKVRFWLLENGDSILMTSCDRSGERYRC